MVSTRSQPRAKLSTSKPVPKANLFSRLPVETQQQIFEHLVCSPYVTSPNLVKAARCNQELYSVVIDSFRRANEFCVSNEGDELKALSNSARCQILNIRFFGCEFWGPTLIFKLFGRDSKLRKFTFQFEGDSIEDYNCGDIGNDFDPLDWTRTFLSGFRYIKTISILFPASNYEVSIIPRKSSGGRDYKNEETIDAGRLIEDMDASLGVKGLQIKGIEDESDRSDDSEDEEDSLHGEIELVEWVWNAKRGGSLKWTDRDA